MPAEYRELFRLLAKVEAGIPDVVFVIFYTTTFGGADAGLPLRV